MSNSASLCYTWWMNIEQRNRLRTESGLPLLNPKVESKRLNAVIEEAEFEREWQRRRLEFAYRWVGNRDGWVANMGRWALARQQVRRQMQSKSIAG